MSWLRSYIHFGARQDGQLESVALKVLGGDPTEHDAALAGGSRPALVMLDDAHMAARVAYCGDAGSDRENLFHFGFLAERVPIDCEAGLWSQVS